MSLTDSGATGALGHQAPLEHDVAAVGSQGRPSLHDRWLAFRDKLLMNRRFQVWAAAFPLTRPIVQWQARGLFDVCAGFVYSQVLQAAVELDLFTILSHGPQTVEALAPELSLSTEATRRLLLAATSLKLVSRRGHDRFGLGIRGATMVANPGLAALVRHHAMLYADLRDPVALLRNGGTSTHLTQYWSYARSVNPAELNRGSVDDYTSLMAASQPLVAAEILAAYPIQNHRCVLDVGGGDGTFLSHVAQRGPHLQLRLFDLPAVADRAKSRLTNEGYGARTEVTGGNFRTDPLPTGADLMTLVRVVYDHDDEHVLALMQAARRALPEDGTLLIAEPMSGTPGAEPMGDAYFGFYLLAMGSGRSRTQNEISDMLRRCGFSRVRTLSTHTPLLVRIVTAQP